MKILTTNFLTCAVKSCRSSPISFPLHFRDAVLSRSELDFQPTFITNILPRIQYDALEVTATELGLQAMLPDKEVVEKIAERSVEGKDEGEEVDEEVLKKLHTLLMETEVREGKLVCANCGFEYPIKEGVANFLLPSHLV
jgi:multifunctional methyltransferase subunit TRM112